MQLKNRHIFIQLLLFHVLQQMIYSMSIIKIPESVWRSAASNHRNRIKTLLQPGLTRRDEQINSGNKRRGNRFVDDWTALDPVNPIYNFLIEYYGIKGKLDLCLLLNLIFLRYGSEIIF